MYHFIRFTNNRLQLGKTTVISLSMMDSNYVVRVACSCNNSLKSGYMYAFEISRVLKSI